MTIRMPVHRLTMAAVTVALATVACENPPIPAPVIEYRPSGPPAETHLRGQVLDLTTNKPLGGATVQVGGTSSITSDDGLYNLQRLRTGATELIASRDGYDTARAFIPLAGGDQSFTVRLRPTPAP